MKIILTQNVPNLGSIGEIKEVKEGFALNYLLPKNLAVKPNDPKALEISLRKKEKRQKEEQKAVQNDRMIQKIVGKKFVFLVKTDAKGKLYGSIGPKEIAKKVGISEDLIKEHFKKIGTYPLKIELGPNQTVEIKIEIKKS